MMEDKKSYIQNIEEVVLAVEDMDESVKLYEDLFGIEFDTEWEMPMDDMVVKSARIGETQFQIVKSTTPDGLIARFIQNNGEGIHHICFKVKDLKGMVDRLKSNGARIVPEEPIDFGGIAYAFVHPSSTHGLLIELLEMRE
ncbi:MAG: methylmalonyl-CoA epimerase [Candidatus Methanolliviera hydrocarbonicum]|uniref:Methylmalonyl-CoA epimerase n=1 Tax=Candidatus Methanolliviera hydrocarbonicum TaxID=2491085 RepID=A0A520KUH4_9EURY|nr:MAG: methylmalonyl-CoA epimerase [Candidatus Methanolliviera hydrocarbonicum]